MGLGKPREDKVLSSAAAALGLKDGAELAKLDRRAMSSCTQRQLFECAKRLQLKGISKLSKDELAVRIASEVAAHAAAPAEDLSARKVSKAPASGAPSEAVEKAPAAADDRVDSMWSHKFEMREHDRAEVPTTIPWSYDARA
jgi:hypothetical protein